MTDLTVSVGTTYKYKARAYNEVNTEGADSSVLTVGVTDTVPPSLPFNLAVTPGDGQLTVTWRGGTDRDILGYDIWMAISGGGYTQLNGSPVPASGLAEWTQIGLTNGTTYCFKLAAVDVRGNRSAQTPEVCGVPQP